MVDDTALFYSRPSIQGGAFPVFSGSRRQTGGSIFGSLKRIFLPIAKKVGKTLLTKGIGLASDIASDVTSGKDLKSSFLTRGKAAAIDFGKSAAREGLNAVTSGLIGSGRRRKRRRSQSLRKVRKSISRKRKRKSRSKSTKRRAKKRRANF